MRSRFPPRRGFSLTMPPRPFNSSHCGRISVAQIKAKVVVISHSLSSSPSLLILPSASLGIFRLLDVHCQLYLALWIQLLCLGTVHGQSHKFPQIWMGWCWRTLIHPPNLGFSYVSSRVIPRLCLLREYFLPSNSRCPRNLSVLRCHPSYSVLLGRIERLHFSFTGFLRCC
jgi:hypothetical protein